MSERPIQPDVMMDKHGNVELCGYLSKTKEGFYCGALLDKLKGELNPIQSQMCPLKDFRSRSCEVLNYTHRFTSGK